MGAATLSFAETLSRHRLPALARGETTTLQVNVGLRCDLACHHCHVEAGPKRSEAMDARLAARVLEVLAASPQLATLDLTGGAPELNPHFRDLVRGARALDRRVIDRCNLTVLFEPGQEDTAAFLAAEGVEIIASLPCHSPGNVDAQRGKRVFERSIAALRELNALGYAQPGSGLELALVYNPLGAFLPAPQAELEADYRRELGALGIRFDRLLTITNMPIRRFARDLARSGKHEAYQALLVNHFNPATVPALMCRSTLSVAWDGSLYDCDFNQALALPLCGPRTLFELDDVRELSGLPIATAAHCFGCTAGAGSSCGGALANP
ncbi:MAG TPA: arsenosugar biosynthesis radical SAM (seleno)protein ArsS [Myxococcota bacterium]|nr:arsenosugar biosynthesis radical SAM (seleno)protein ArsS [Myxococcota bacterium]